jgi:hypothetical protein
VAKLRVEPGSGGSAAGGASAGASARKQRTVALVGAMPQLAKGRRVCVEGEWVMDKKYGAQLKARRRATHTGASHVACTQKQRGLISRLVRCCCVVAR